METRTKWVVIPIIALTIIFFSCSEDSSPVDPNGNGTQDEFAWQIFSSLPLAVEQINPVAYDGRIYVFGGMSFDSFSRRGCSVFDPELNAWSSVASLPERRFELSTCVIGNIIYVLGGYASNFMLADDMYVYNPADDTWTIEGLMPRPVGITACSPYNGKIYLFGGNDQMFNNQNYTQVYDPFTQQWELKTPIPTLRRGSVSLVINNLIYVIGGRVDDPDYAVNTGANEAYSPATDTWTTLASMPTPQGAIAGAVKDGKIYIFGGQYSNANSEGVFSNSWEYDPQTDTWREIIEMRTARHSMGAVMIDDIIYVIGGSDARGNSPSDRNEGLIFNYE